MKRFSLIRSQKGQAALEYAIVLGAVILAVIALINSGAIKQAFNAASNKLQNATSQIGNISM
jgi:Flp pilus assembly pilin Flp